MSGWLAAPCPEVGALSTGLTTLRVLGALGDPTVWILPPCPTEGHCGWLCRLLTAEGVTIQLCAPLQAAPPVEDCIARRKGTVL